MKPEIRMYLAGAIGLLASAAAALAVAYMLGLLR